VTLTATRVRPSAGRAAITVDPSTILGSALVGWWRSDSLSGLADGTGIASWADKSTNGNTLAQGTGGNQPVKQTDGTRSLPVARFTGASHHNLAITSPVGLKDAPGPLTVLVVAKLSAASGRQALVEYAGSGNHGFAAATNAASLVLEDYVNGGASATAITAALWLYHYEMPDSTHGNCTQNNEFGTSSSGTRSFTAGSTRLALGGSLLHNQWWLDGDLYEVIYVNRLLTAAERDAIARKYINPRYGLTVGTQYNAPAKMTVPTIQQIFGGSATADGTVVEQSVQYFPSGWNGHKYWLACVPYGSGPAVENPNLFYSDDNATWSTPSGVTNPLVPPRSSGNNSDPKLVYNAADGKLYLFWCVQADTTTAHNGIWCISSSDGSSWSAATQVFVSTDGTAAQEPCPVWDGTQWVLYTQNASVTPNKIQRRTSSSLTSGYGSATDVVLPMPGSRSPWHIDLAYSGGTWVLCTSDNDSPRNMWLATSGDGIHFTVNATPTLVRSLAGWDGGILYRPTIRPPDDATTKWRLWYATNISQPNSFMGYTEVPASELP
jgi:hypothetical protein